MQPLGGLDAAVKYALGMSYYPRQPVQAIGFVGCQTLFLLAAGKGAQGECALRTTK